jgi:hypothetical protein
VKWEQLFEILLQFFSTFPNLVHILRNSG